jgi:hypothetical protein
VSFVTAALGTGVKREMRAPIGPERAVFDQSEPF